MILQGVHQHGNASGGDGPRGASDRPRHEYAESMIEKAQADLSDDEIKRKAREMTILAYTMGGRMHYSMAH